MTLPTIERPYKEDGKQGKGLVSHGDLVDSKSGGRGSRKKGGGGAIDRRSGVLHFYGGECAGNLPKANADNYMFYRTGPKNYVAIV